MQRVAPSHSRLGQVGIAPSYGAGASPPHVPLDPFARVTTYSTTE